MFTLAQLGGYVAVAEELHFGRAAQRLHMTQPPLSRQIQALERELGVRLLDRSGQTVRMTPAGRVFLEDARRLLREAESVVRTVRHVPTGRFGTISVGFTAGSAPSVLGPLVVRLRRELPGVDVMLRELSSLELLDKLSGRVLDLGLLRPPVNRHELSSREILRESLVVAVPAGHHLAEHETLRVEDLDGEEVIMPMPGESAYFYDLFVSLFYAAGISVRRSQYLSRMHTVMTFVRAGAGLGLLPESAVEFVAKDVEVRRLLTDEPQPARLEAAWRSENDNPVLGAVFDLLWSGSGEAVSLRAGV